MVRLLAYLWFDSKTKEIISEADACLQPWKGIWGNLKTIRCYTNENSRVEGETFPVLIGSIFVAWKNCS